MIGSERYFEWLDGEKLGAVEVLDHMVEEEGSVYYVFRSGEMCNADYICRITMDSGDLKGMAMTEVQDYDHAWKFEKIKVKTYRDEQTGEVSEIADVGDITSQYGRGGSKDRIDLENSVIGRYRLVHPVSEGFRGKFPLPDMNLYLVKSVPEPEPKKETALSDGNTVDSVKDYVQCKNNDQVSSDQETCVNKTCHSDESRWDGNPVKILVDKSKKRETDVVLDMKLYIPGVSVYMVAESEFENGGNDFIDYIVDDIDTDSIRESLRSALMAAYSEKCK